MDIKHAFKWAQLKLEQKSSSVNLDIEILLSFIINKNKTFIYTYPDYQLTSTQIIKFKKIINRRTQGEPIAYLIGSKNFYGLNFIVNKYVLIPRPETEIMVTEILKNKKIKTIADIGTGSGCIAISLAKNNHRLKIYASDISSLAINVAQKNTFHNKVNKYIIFKKGNLLTPYKNTKLDAIAANLPYLKFEHKKLSSSLETIGLKFEPNIALYADKNGLDSYQQLLTQIKQLKYTPNSIYLEINPPQTLTIKKIIKSLFPQAKITVKKDLARLNRLIIINL